MVNEVSWGKEEEGKGTVVNEVRGKGGGEGDGGE